MGSVYPRTIRIHSRLKDHLFPKRFKVCTVAVVSNTALAWHVQRDDTEISALDAVGVSAARVGVPPVCDMLG
jgi:hypothetical protein